MTPLLDSELRENLAGVRALLLDMDGVLILKDAPIAGVSAALTLLESRGIPYAIGTDTSRVSRATLAREMQRAGLPVNPERIISAASAAAGYCRRHCQGEPVYVLGSADGLTEFDGMRLLSHDEAAKPDAEAAAGVIGDAAEEFTPGNLQSAFALLRNGARFVAMHKNRWWITPAGVMLDAGAYVAGLEYVTQRRALVTGKPSRTFFAEALPLLSHVPGAGPDPGISPRDVAMVGDDLWNDVRGAQRAGLRGVFVLSGKHGPAELARAAAQGRGWRPDAVAPSVVEVIQALA